MPTELPDRLVPMPVDETTHSWTDGALCAQIDPDLWFADKGGARWSVDKSREVCRACPVAKECLRRSLEAHPVDGVWAGLTPVERLRVTRLIASTIGGAA